MEPRRMFKWLYRVETRQLETAEFWARFRREAVNLASAWDQHLSVRPECGDGVLRQWAADVLSQALIDGGQQQPLRALAAGGIPLGAAPGWTFRLCCPCAGFQHRVSVLLQQAQPLIERRHQEMRKVAARKKRRKRLWGWSGGLLRMVTERHSLSRVTGCVTARWSGGGPA